MGFEKFILVTCFVSKLEVKYMLIPFLNKLKISEIMYLCSFLLTVFFVIIRNCSVVFCLTRGDWRGILLLCLLAACCSFSVQKQCVFTAVDGPHSPTLLAVSILEESASIILGVDMYRSRSWWVSECTGFWHWFCTSLLLAREHL